MRNKKLIDLYYKWVEDGKLPNIGLCDSIPKKYLKKLKLFEPDELEKISIIKRGRDVYYWGFEYSPFKYSLDEMSFSFTPLRQSIILPICAMHGEI